ncbi:MAG TPA: glycosyltransferase family 2 protein [Polyangiaceae bacterium]|nr:glycosyltransferase family 2 protein [Polyangiaceae bacterium]
MWSSARIAVIVPAYREARLIGRMLRRVPAFVDAVVVVDDASDDDTSAAARAIGDPRVQVIRHPENRGVGASIATGYQHAAAAGADVLAVMAGDDQMDPDDLEAVIAPVVRGEADYVKGNRFAHPAAHQMPRARRIAGAVLSGATRLATGLAITDAQCGYTALSARAAARLPLDELWPRYGYPNDLLGLAAARGLRVREVPVRPVYADETSGVRPWHALLVLYVLARRRLLASGDH